MSHAVEFFSVCFFLWSVLGKGAEERRWGLIGVAAGIMAIARWQNAFLLLLVPLVLFEEHGLKLKRETLSAFCRKGVTAVLYALPFVAVQAVFWKLTSGSFVTVPQGEGFLLYTAPAVLEVLFSLRHGLFSWHPIAFLGVIGLALALRETYRRYAVFFLGAFAVATYINGIVFDWWAGDAFGMRRFAGTVPLLIFGLATLYFYAQEWRWPKRVLLGVFALLVVANGLFAVQYTLNLISHGDAISVRELTIDRLLVAGQVLEKIVE
jgi:hypothetical protein